MCTGFLTLVWIRTSPNSFRTPPTNKLFTAEVAEEHRREHRENPTILGG